MTEYTRHFQMPSILFEHDTHQRLSTTAVVVYSVLWDLQQHSPNEELQGILGKKIPNYLRITPYKYKRALRELMTIGLLTQRGKKGTDLFKLKSVESLV